GDFGLGIGGLGIREAASGGVWLGIGRDFGGECWGIVGNLAVEIHGRDAYATGIGIELLVLLSLLLVLLLLLLLLKAGELVVLLGLGALVSFDAPAGLGGLERSDVVMRLFARADVGPVEAVADGAGGFAGLGFGVGFGFGLG